MPLFFSDFVVPMLRAPCIDLSVRESCIGIHVKRRQRFGNRRGGDTWGARGLRVRWLQVGLTGDITTVDILYLLFAKATSD